MIFWQPEPVTRDLDRLVHYAGLWGVDGIELRSLGNQAQRVPDINEAPVRRRIADEELVVLLSDSDVFAVESEDVAGWMNDLLRFPDLAAFNKRMGIGATIVDGMEGDGPVPMEPFQRLLELADAAGQRILIRDEERDTRVPDLLNQLGHPTVKRAVSRGLEPGSWSTSASDVGLIRCRAVVHDLVEQDSVEASWKSLLTDMVSCGFDGDIVLEFGGAEVGKNGLRLSTALIRAARAAFRT